MSQQSPQLEAIVLAFNADWSIGGGLSYLAKTVQGDEPCELCKITYGGLTKKSDWKTCEKQITAPVREVYKNQLDAELESAIAGRFPSVLAETDRGYIMLITPDQMDSFEGQPTALYAAMVDAISANEIRVGAA